MLKPNELMTWDEMVGKYPENGCLWKLWKGVELILIGV